MASEWVGVVGALGGAGIGGVVTVASLIVKSREDEAAEKRRNEWEDRRRADERAWDVKQHNVEQRRSLYAELLRQAAAVNYAIGTVMNYVHWQADPHARESLVITQELLEEKCQRGWDEIRRFEALAATCLVTAVDRNVIDSARRLGTTFDDAMGLGDPSIEEVGRSETRSLRQLVEEAHALTETLANACRRDLSYDTSATEPLGEALK